MSVLTDAEAVRYWQHVVKGPGERDCWIWVGAIADDGYGRFWTTRDERARVLRPHRIAFSLATGISLDELAVVEHLVCDNPICVRSAGDERDHLAGGTQADNLARMARRNRGGGKPLMVRPPGLGRAELAARSRAIREIVREGWDTERLARLLVDHDQSTLW
ncbi:hypothetical protein ACHAAC_17045 [Aeromicrobium sp. CF4.19]|uniref:hypothetical protein n=1 Tax=Aeromicrobium sp. CF4.19 TaxID=3373082 RepID=UPI003EE5C7F5